MPKIEKVETFCIGHHLVDLPDGFHLVMPFSASFRPKNMESSSSTIEISVVAESIAPITFAADLQKRTGEIIAFSDDTTDILKEVVSKGSNAILFRILKIEDSYSSELHLLKDDLHVTAKADSYYGRFTEAETNLFNIADQIRSVRRDDGNVHSGFFLGPVVVHGLYEEESASFTFRSDKQPDIRINIDIDTFGRDESSALLQRVGGPDSLLAIFDARNTVLRKGESTVAGLQAQEWLSSVKLGANRDAKKFGFALETLRRKPGLASPRIHIELDTGQHDRHGVQQPNSLTDEQAIALWDSVIASIRLRPEINK